MSKANEFRTYAEECLTWARAAETPEKKEQYFAMATTWMQAAMLQATKNEQALQELAPTEPTYGDARIIHVKPSLENYVPTDRET